MNECLQLFPMVPGTDYELNIDQNDMLNITAIICLKVLV